MDPIILGCLAFVSAIAIGATFVLGGRRAKRAGSRG